MINRTFFNRISGFRTLGLLAALAGLSIFWACHINEADNQDHFDLKVDSTLASCDSLVVILEDTNGAVIDTLFNDTLKSLSQLSNLDVGKYQGGKARVRITGSKDGGLCVEQVRTFDDKGTKVVIDTFSIPGTPPKSVEVTPATLNLKAGDAGVPVQAVIIPQFADQLFEWSVDDASVATLDLPDGSNAGQAVVIPLKNGTTRIKVKAKQDGAKFAEIVVQVGSVGGRSVTIVPDSLDLYLGGPDSSLKAVTAPDSIEEPVSWSSNDESIVKVDEEGKVHALKEGLVTIKAAFGEATATARVRVMRDVPVLTVASKSGAAVNTLITFSPKSTQTFGSIVMFKWDLDGDGNYDDSLPGPFLGASVDLPAQTATYTKEGLVKPKFLVRDGEGNEAVTEVSIDIGNQPPEVLSKTSDTLISINDVLTLEAKVRDAEGKVSVVGFDYDGDGKLDDSVKAGDSVATLKVTHKFVKVGKHVILIIATDDAGKSSTDSVRVGVLLDPPVADMGPDISIIAGSPVAFSVKGTDKFGSIAKREIKIGSASYLNLGKQDTSIIVPGDSGKVEVIGRVTDDDGISDEDTMVVTLLPPTKSNNDLSSLVPSAGSLTPVFKPVTVAYTLQVGYNDSNVAMTALTTDPQATLVINGAPAVSGKISDSVAIKVGTTQKVFEIVVTAQDGTQKTYTVSITRAPSADTRLSKLEPTGFGLKPAFLPALLEYADTVAFAVASVSVKPTSVHPAAKISVNDSVVVSGTASKAVSLIVGDNLIKVEVTAQDGKTKAVYNVKVVRRAKLIVSRTVGAASAVLIDSLEAPLGTAVNLSSKDTTGFHFTKWTVTAGTGTFQDSLANPGKVILKSPTVRVQGTMVVNTYQITSTIKGFVGGAFEFPSITIEHGKDTTIKITPLVGYRVLTVSDNGKEVSFIGLKNLFGVRTFRLTNVTGKHDIEVTFLKTYTINASATGLGLISPLGNNEVDSNSTIELTMTSTSPSTGVWVSALSDNGTDVAASVTGDRMNISKYSIPAIKANHTVIATFAIKTFTLTITGHHLCIRKIVSCPVGQICPILICFANTGADADTLTVEYGSSYNITTDDSLGTRPFLNWSKDNINVGTNTSITTGPITSNLTYTAIYRLIIVCCPGPCCVIGGPVVGAAGSTAAPIGSPTSPVAEEGIPTPLLQSKEPTDEN